jgi:hypothetical protein
LAKYTTQIRSLVESGVKIFDFDYPIFDPAYKSVLESKIINHYYFREIGLETVGQFKWFLKSKMNIIMPLYNEHYKAVELFKTYDPYKNKNVTTTDTRTNTQETTGTSDTNTNSSSNVTATTDGDSTDTVTGKDVFSDTPQAKLQNLDYATNVTEKDGSSTNTSHGESTQDVTDTTTGSSSLSGTVTTIDEYTQTIAGHDGMKYPAGILQEIRETFINIDEMIIDELQDLFMNIY